MHKVISVNNIPAGDSKSPLERVSEETSSLAYNQSVETNELMNYKNKPYKVYNVCGEGVK